MTLLLISRFGSQYLFILSEDMIDLCTTDGATYHEETGEGIFQRYIQLSLR
jgi:hypothetical protein